MCKGLSLAWEKVITVMLGMGQLICMSEGTLSFTFEKNADECNLLTSNLYDNFISITKHIWLRLCKNYQQSVGK